MADSAYTCTECAAQFYTGGVADSAYCSEICAARARSLRYKRSLLGLPCRVDGCDGSARSKASGLCEKHYMRLRRNGTLDRISKPNVITHSGGYILVPASGHPLRRGKSGVHEYEHRVVFYDEHGSGPFTCHVCGSGVTWEAMHVDHLNDIVDDNRIENLAPACPTCNQWRGREKMKATNRRKSAYKITFAGETMCLGQWARRVGISKTGLRERLRRGWPLSRALTAPPRLSQKAR